MRQMAAEFDHYSCIMDGKENDESSVDRLKKLYPAVKEEKTPLPRAWSVKEKYNYIGLSQNNLRVHYKGHGKTHRDAASVQATYPIPAACGLYYFEVKIISKGRDGYMGVGLSAQGVNMNRLPGWDKLSYGYHGDDGHSFCSSGTGQPYGPTFTTGDVIGCGVNLVDNTCFYTKNGHHLGIAFTDLPPNLYPTVGLQTPGEVVDANFGQEPFVFDIEDMMNELRSRTRQSIYDFSIPQSQGEWQEILNKIVSTYLVHHGYCSTAEAFTSVTNQPFNEDPNSIRNRQKILKLVLAGRMGEAIDKTKRIYPGLLEHNQNLLFTLKCRQFVEMINGSDVEVRHSRSIYSPVFGNSSSRPCSPIQTSVIQSTKNYCNKSKVGIDAMNQSNLAVNGNANSKSSTVIKNCEESDIEMDTEEVHNGFSSENGCNGNNKFKKSSQNGFQSKNTNHINYTFDCSEHASDEEMEIDSTVRKSCKPAVERILEFGRELYCMSQRLKNEENKTNLMQNDKMLEDVFSLLAYSNPWSSPVGWQLDPGQRESVCAYLNSAILGSQNKARKPPLEVIMSHSQELIRLMSDSGLGSCAFASVSDLMDH